jgi:hypothetical protein
MRYDKGRSIDVVDQCFYRGVSSLHSIVLCVFTELLAMGAAHRDDEIRRIGGVTTEQAGADVSFRSTSLGS